jgi:hypothetical protein
VRGLALLAKAAAATAVAALLSAAYGLATLARVMDEAEQELT